MPLLSDYLNFNGVPGTQGPQGFQGDPAASITVKGIDTWAAISAIAVPDVNDLWIMNEVTGAPDRYDLAPAEIGDAVVWDGAAWINVGPIQGPQGPQGFQGTTGYGIQMKGSDTWANISLIVTPVINDVWVMTAVDAGTPLFGLEPAVVGDMVVWNAIEWENIGPLAGPQGFQGDTGSQGPQGFDGVTGVQGVDGTQGPQGIQGSVGASITIIGNDTWANISAIVTPGTNDAWFMTEVTGAPAPPNPPAAIGDIVVWSGIEWVNAGPIQGPQGFQGAQGAVGADSTVVGPQGDTGPQGTQGFQGVVGQTGVAGTQGPQGVIGSTGFQGPQGYQGNDGADAGDFNKSISIEVPSASENITFFFTNRALTVNQIRAVLVGSGGPSLSFSMGYATDRTATPTVISAATVTDVLTGVDTPISQANIPANNWVWIVTTAFVGTVDHINLTLLGSVPP